MSCSIVLTVLVASWHLALAENPVTQPRVPVEENKLQLEMASEFGLQFGDVRCCGSCPRAPDVNVAVRSFWLK